MRGGTGAVGVTFGRDERRAQLVELAGRLALERGIGAVSMESLAAAAEVNKRIVYRVFPNRSAVLAALFERELGGVLNRIIEAGAGVASIEEWLRAAIRVWFDAVAASDGLVSILVDSAHADAELLDRRHTWQRDSVDAWAGGIAAVTGADIEDARDTVAIVLAGLRGALLRWRDEGRPREVVEARLCSVALAAIDRLQTAPTKTPKTGRS